MRGHYLIVAMLIEQFINTTSVKRDDVVDGE